MLSLEEMSVENRRMYELDLIEYMRDDKMSLRRYTARFSDFLESDDPIKIHLSAPLFGVSSHWITTIRRTETKHRPHSDG